MLQSLFKIMRTQVKKFIDKLKPRVKLHSNIIGIDYKLAVGVESFDGVNRREGDKIVTNKCIAIESDFHIASLFCWRDGFEIDIFAQHDIQSPQNIFFVFIA